MFFFHGFLFLINLEVFFLHFIDFFSSCGSFESLQKHERSWTSPADPQKRRNQIGTRSENGERSYYRWCSFVNPFNNQILVKDEYRKFEWKLESNQREFEAFEDEILIDAEIASDEYSEQMNAVFKEAGKF